VVVLRRSLPAWQRLCCHAHLELGAAGVCLDTLTQRLNSTGHKATLLTIDATLQQQQQQQQQ
jgi:hypothetical protein